MRVGIIGLGSIGIRHAKNALELGREVVGYDCGVVVACGGMSVCWSLRGVIDCNALLICTPAATHASVAKELLALGYRGPLFCEKPLALSVEDCAVFRDWPHPTTMVGYMLRHHPIVRALKHIKPNHIRLILRCDMRDWPGQFYAPAMYELSHEIDLAFHLGATEATPDKYHNGCVNTDIGYVELDGYCGDYDRTWMVSGVGGSVQASFSKPDLLGGQMYVDELAHFLDCAAEGIPTITPFADGIRVVQVCEDAMKLAGVTT